MMQPFEFANNAASLFLSIFSLIVGMTYPLILQAMQRIDEMYRSFRITNLLRQESCFKNFQRSVVISLAFSFASIFVLQIFDGCDLLVVIWVSIHALVTLYLLTSMLSLIYMIMKYYHADDLLEHINSLRNHERSRNK